MSLGNVLILGAGLIGKTIAKDLSDDFSVTSADINQVELDKLKSQAEVEVLRTDLSDSKILTELCTDFDLVVGAVPGFMGFKVLETVIQAGKNIVDISFFPEDPFRLDELAKSKNVTAIVDCGVAPGLCNLIAGFHYRQMKIECYECLVGGLPVKRELPFEYKSLFSPVDVIEEYVRDVRIIDDGEYVTKDALSDCQLVEFPETGLLESFNTDGLRTLLKTMNGVPNMREKTLRYPGHAKLMKAFRETGLFRKDEISIDGCKITPLSVTSSLLFPMWKLNEGDDDFTIMRITISGNEKGQIVNYEYTLFDKSIPELKLSSMARTTGYTCTATVRALATSKINQKGISPPEYLGFNKETFDFIIGELQARGIKFDLKKLIN
ncbi:saccharopine dehydrogenase [Ignavibacteria bacterium CHB1]|nr:MAG: saccharopine dehydrogenase [Chlorobiota bacterium]MBV6398404.1 Lysine 6-dehydrogenase [Ignavibacteria bacterium]MCC6886004.1 saccharopine dehydrogenase NADP-binding domain-containing protein [Ignavibacteriales bacterium]MCE7952746.1 saccharopine dehydrogenase [Chlorobi bacterium CHB7]MDL1886856.1 saccharopine dehydrogenase [Ignavibacteria bacterium CHB1]RIK50379.1 MAG: saccharopine dehydrogenase [Ignavibacteriota bacterium]